MTKRLAVGLGVLLAVLAARAWGQGVRLRPDCEVEVTLTAAGTSQWLDARNTGCVSWTLAYTSTGFSAVDIEAQEAPDASGSPGSAVVWPSGSVYVGSLPLASTSSGYAEMVGQYGWVRIDATTLTGTGTLEATLYGWRAGPGLPAAWSCNNGIGTSGSGPSAIGAGTYTVSTCFNATKQTVTISGIECKNDAGSSTMDVAVDGGSDLLTGPITCGTSWTAGAQSATVTLGAGDSVTFTTVADGTTKSQSWVIIGTY